MRGTLIVLGLSVAGFLAPAAFAEPLSPGTAMPPLTLADQHDTPGSVDTATRLVIFTGDMDASDHVKEALTDEGTALLDSAGAVWIANISRMPRIITKLFAMPSLRKRPYRMLLDRDGTATADFPANSGQVTLLHLDHLKIARIEYADSAAQVAKALRQTAAAGAAAENED
jgi:hypothetical protein